MNWPNCPCGHSAHAHNKHCGQEPKNFGCDHCTCTMYRFPVDFPKDKADALRARRDEAWGEYK